jgi:hypothetical protein
MSNLKQPGSGDPGHASGQRFRGWRGQHVDLQPRIASNEPLNQTVGHDHVANPGRGNDEYLSGPGTRAFAGTDHYRVGSAVTS